MKTRMEMARTTDAFALLSICKHPSMERLMSQIDLASRARSVLISGETGSGKELVAQAVHDLGGHSEGPFVALNCANQNRELVGSELFGHEEGSFTGSTGRHIGVFETANKGTLFLDEVGDMPMEIQGRLLRVLETQTFTRVGGTGRVYSDFQMVAATNRDLRVMVKERTFREDLYWRLNVFPILVPPLRERKEDIRPLTEYFLKEFSGQKTIEPGVIDVLAGHSWPGNVRELRNVIERAVILARGGPIELEHVILEASQQQAEDNKSHNNSQQHGDMNPLFQELVSMAYRDGFWPVIELVEKTILKHAFEAGGNRSAASKLINLEFNTLQSKLGKFGLLPPELVPAWSKKERLRKAE